MKFDELDKKMRVYETAADVCAVPGMYLVARIDGRSFTRLTKDVHQFEAPFDERFRDMMIATTEHVMTCGFRCVYGFTQSDEISILIDCDDDTFGRKLRKLNSVFAGEASAKFSVLLGDVAAFDCRICQLPTLQLVVDYFRWRNEDAHRNALNAHCYWLLRKKGSTARQATAHIFGASVPEKNELLYSEGGVNFNDIPAWQKRGVGVYWESFEKEGENPVTGETTTTQRRRLKRDFELPMRDDYNTFVSGLLAEKRSGAVSSC